MLSEEPYETYHPEFPDPEIRRIALKSSAVVELLRIESPSSFFCRPVDHVTDDQLLIREPYRLTTRIIDFSAGNMAMAPLRPRVFARCLILKNLELIEAARIFFIDSAVTANVSWKCLFQIDENLKFHPWQAMHCTLGRLVHLSDSWTDTQCTEFRNIVSKFAKFQITANQCDVDFRSDRPSLLVNLYGLPNGTEIDKKVAIEEICAVSMQNVMVSQFPTNFMVNPKLEELDKEQDHLDVILLEEFRRDLPADWAHEPPADYREDDADWDILQCHVAEWNDTALEQFRRADGSFWAMLEPSCTVSPWEMHVTPILAPEKMSDNEHWIFEQLVKNSENQQKIDDFYSNLKNQRPLEMEEIKFALQTGRTYVMATIKNRQKSSAQWLRCEIIDFLPNANVALRYVDLGTRGILKLKNLHRMHIEHTKIAPACIEIGRFLDDDLSMADSEMEWNTHFWREIVPYDVPIVVGPDMEFLETGKLQFSQIRVAGDEDDENLLDKIPSPSPFFTERSDDLRTQKEDDDDGNVSDDKDSG